MFSKQYCLIIHKNLLRAYVCTLGFYPLHCIVLRYRKGTVFTKQIKLDYLLDSLHFSLLEQNAAKEIIVIFIYCYRLLYRIARNIESPIREETYFFRNLNCGKNFINSIRLRSRYFKPLPKNYEIKLSEASSRLVLGNHNIMSSAQIICYFQKPRFSHTNGRAGK